MIQNYFVPASDVLLLEHWKPVVGYEGYYEISNVGSVRRIKGGPGTRAGKIVNWVARNDGYPEIRPCTNGQQTRKLIHHAVAQSFLGPRPDGLIINHIDGWKWNPRLSNIEYITPRGNYDHAVENGLMARGIRSPHAVLDDEKVSKIKWLPHEITAEQAAIMFGVTDGAIYRIWHGKNWKHIAGPIRRRLPAKGRQRAALRTSV